MFWFSYLHLSVPLPFFVSLFMRLILCSMLPHRVPVLYALRISLTLQCICCLARLPAACMSDLNTICLYELYASFSAQRTKTVTGT